MKKILSCKRRLSTITIFAASLLLGLLAQSQENKNFDSLIAQIDFQKGFVNDTISVKINNTTIVKAKTANTHPLVDFTGIELEIFYLNNESRLVVYQNKKIKINSFTKSIIIEIELNRVANKFEISLAKGNFIGFSKTKDNNLEIIQSKRRFFYD